MIQAMKPFELLRKHSRIIGAMILRETTTRYGREGLGFLWVVGEPLLFCGVVLIMWSIIKPEYEHGIRLGPFVMSGYMCLILLRHTIGFLISAVQANGGLLYHRQIKVLHIFVSRVLLEFFGTTAAFVVVYIALAVLGQIGLPADFLKLYGGWLILGGMATGMALILAALSMRSELMERLVPVLNYAMIPISGAFFMIGWLPASVRDMILWIPFPNAVEMLRDGLFGEFVPTYYSVSYALICMVLMNFLGLLLVATLGDLTDVE